MTKNTIANLTVNGSATIIVGDKTNNQQNSELGQLLDILVEIRKELSQTQLSDSKLLESLQQSEQIKTGSPKNIKKINRVLTEVKEYMKTGSQLGKLYARAKKILEIIKEE